MNVKLILMLTACLSTAPLAADTAQETTVTALLSTLLGIPEPALVNESTLRDYIHMHRRTVPEQKTPTNLINTLVNFTMALKETLQDNIDLFAGEDAKKQRFYLIYKGTKFNILITQEPEPTESSLLNKIGSFIWSATKLIGAGILVLGLPKTNTVTFNGWQYTGK